MVRGQPRLNIQGTYLISHLPQTQKDPFDEIMEEMGLWACLQRIILVIQINMGRPILIVSEQFSGYL